MMFMYRKRIQNLSCVFESNRVFGNELIFMHFLIYLNYVKLHRMQNSFHKCVPISDAFIDEFHNRDFRDYQISK